MGDENPLIAVKRDHKDKNSGRNKTKNKIPHRNKKINKKSQLNGKNPNSTNEKTNNKEENDDKSKIKKDKKGINLNIDSKLEYENEIKIRELEDRIADKEWMRNPNSVMDFERLVVTNARSSAVWIAYMAFYINSGDIEMARKTVKRGLKAIDFREMTEKMNLWVAYLNMECIYGNNVMEIFKQAVQYNDSKSIHLKMIKIFVNNNQLDKAKEICEKAIKKFHKSKKIWLAYLRLLYENMKDFEAGRQLQKICITRIPEKKRIYITSSTALLEYKHGSPEMGKMYFENILLDNPKRMDIWNQYLTAHIKLNMDESKTQKSEGLKNVRKLFERAITLELKPKKMRIIFSKWLEFECAYGTEKSKESVQKKALKYVEYIEKKLNS